jgi:lysozyme family protein
MLSIALLKFRTACIFIVMSIGNMELWRETERQGFGNHDAHVDTSIVYNSTAVYAKVFSKCNDISST